MSKRADSKMSVAIAAFIVATLAAGRSGAVALVFEGSTYFTQTVGAILSGGPFGGVVFDPTPIGPGGSSIVIEHTSSVVVNGGAAPFLLTLLAAHSAAPVMIGGHDYDLSIALDPAHLAQDVGTITIDGNASGGSYTVTSDYYINETLTSVTGPPTTIVMNAHVIGSSLAPGTWSATAPAGTFLLPGPFDNRAAALAGNVHAGLPTVDLVDFFPTGDLKISESGSLGGTTTLTVLPTSVPEPAVWSLASIGAFGLGAALRRRRASARLLCSLA
jgi:hypothetical protein